MDVEASTVVLDECYIFTLAQRSECAASMQSTPDDM